MEAVSNDPTLAKPRHLGSTQCQNVVVQARSFSDRAGNNISRDAVTARGEPIPSPFGEPGPA
jgi:hypothetical protein